MEVNDGKENAGNIKKTQGAAIVGNVSNMSRLVIGIGVRALTGWMVLIAMVLLCVTITGLSLKFVALLVCGGILLKLSIIDIQCYLLPDRWVGPLLWGGLLVNAYGLFIYPRDAILGAAAGYLTLTSVRIMFRHICKREGLGGGDVKLFSALGAWGGTEILAPVLGIASLSGLLIFAAWRSVFGAPLKLIPFGPSLAGAGWSLLLLQQTGTDMLFFW